jgi:transposase InsO family protein
MDITYVPLASGFMYLAAILDWFSRYVLAWRLSNTLDGSFSLEMCQQRFSMRPKARGGPGQSAQPGSRTGPRACAEVIRAP